MAGLGSQVRLSPGPGLAALCWREESLRAGLRASRGPAASSKILSPGWGLSTGLRPQPRCSSDAVWTMLCGRQLQDTQRGVGQDLRQSAAPVPGRASPDLPWMPPGPPPPSACQQPPGQDFSPAVGQRPRRSPGPRPQTDPAQGSLRQAHRRGAILALSTWTWWSRGRPHCVDMTPPARQLSRDRRVSDGRGEKARPFRSDQSSQGTGLLRGQ